MNILFQMVTLLQLMVLGRVQRETTMRILLELWTLKQREIKLQATIPLYTKTEQDKKKTKKWKKREIDIKLEN